MRPCLHSGKCMWLRGMRELAYLQAFLHWPHTAGWQMGLLRSLRGRKGRLVLWHKQSQQTSLVEVASFAFHSPWPQLLKRIGDHQVLLEIMGRNSHPVAENYRPWVNSFCLLSSYYVPNTTLSSFVLAHLIPIRALWNKYYHYFCFTRTQPLDFLTSKNQLIFSRVGIWKRDHNHRARTQV